MPSRISKRRIKKRDYKNRIRVLQACLDDANATANKQNAEITRLRERLGKGSVFWVCDAPGTCYEVFQLRFAMDPRQLVHMDEQMRYDWAMRTFNKVVTESLRVCPPYEHAYRSHYNHMKEKDQ